MDALAMGKKRTCRTVCSCTDDAKTRPIVPFSSMDKGEFLMIPNIGCILVQVIQEAVTKTWKKMPVRENGKELGKQSDSYVGLILSEREREGKKIGWRHLKM